MLQPLSEKSRKYLWEHWAISFTSVPEKQVLKDTISKHTEGKKGSGSVVIYLPRADDFSTDQITFLFEIASILSKGRARDCCFTKAFSIIFHSILVAKWERFNLDR